MAKIKSIQELIKEVSPYYEKNDPSAEHTIVYDSSSETLEPLYFWILDFMENIGLNVEKLVDNFSSSAGSSHFSEIGQRASIVQQQATKLMGDINTVLRSVLNLIYDLKEFRMRLKHYEELKSKDKETAEAARLALKQLWMDKVDMQKQNSSIKAMALGQAGYQTLIDAFLVVNNEKDVNKLDLNDRVKRVLIPRIKEFNIWVDESEKELKKRYNLEKNYLKSQVNSLKLYSRWVKPYLKAAQKLEQKDMDRSPELVNIFSTLVLELTLLGKSKFDLKKTVLSGDLSQTFMKYKQKRDYYSCVLVDLNFRGIPQKYGQGYVFGGKAEVTFRGYCLNEDELKLLDKKIDESDIGAVLNMVEGATDESLEELQEEIDYFLNDEDKEEEENKKKSEDTSNPFLALVGYYNKPNNKEKKKEKKEEITEAKKDDWVESYIREYCEDEASDKAFLVFDIYKKSHGMASFV